ncbi:MAG: hypothetical protein JO360_17145 [Acidobacteria bacterium]|nr:hypothetical protein [Acidobacteriota bacterium]
MKINKLIKGREIILLLAIMLLACFMAAGQQAPRFSQLQYENAKELRQYSWRSRTEIRKGGETRSVQLYVLRYDAGGVLQKTNIGGTQPDIPTRGLRGLIAKKKRDEFLELIDGLGALAKSYGEIPPEKMQQFMRRATVTLDTNNGLLRLQASDVMQPGDTMSLWVDAVTRRQRRVEVQTAFEQSPLRLVSEFRDLPLGPTYLSRSVVDYPSRELTITTENYDYAHN